MLRSDMHLPRTAIRIPLIKKLTSFNAQELVPIGVYEVIPGSTWRCDCKMIARMATPLVPVMDDAFVEYYAYFVPMRLVWNKTKEFFGENSGAWYDTETTYEIPQCTYPIGSAVDALSFPQGFEVGSLADYMGMPIGVYDKYVSESVPHAKTHNALLYRAYCLIWNKEFRDQNYQPEAYIPMDSGLTSGVQRYNYTIVDGSYVRSSQRDPILNAYRGGPLLPTCRFHDYFSDVFPSPQKGPEALIPASGDPLMIQSPHLLRTTDALTAQGAVIDIQETTKVLAARFGSSSAATVGAIKDGSGRTLQSLMGNINDLRLAVAVQRYYEANLGGTRFNEYIRSHFGVDVGDARIQVPEQIGYGKVRLGMTQVVQTSSTDDTSPQGHTAAYSLTGDKQHFFSKTFVEPGYVLVLATCRPARSYGQGVPALFRRRDLFDLYDPKFAYIGMTPVYKSEIYEDADTANSTEEPVWGYHQAWESYLNFPRTFSGYMRPQGNLTSFDLQSLYYWHYGDSYESAPTMGSTWLTSGAENMDRTLAVSSSLSHQIIFDMTLAVEMIAPIPADRRPGLMDHL